MLSYRRTSRQAMVLPQQQRGENPVQFSIVEDAATTPRDGDRRQLGARRGHKTMTDCGFIVPTPNAASPFRQPRRLCRLLPPCPLDGWTQRNAVGVTRRAGPEVVAAISRQLQQLSVPTQFCTSGVACLVAPRGRIHKISYDNLTIILR